MKAAKRSRIPWMIAALAGVAVALTGTRILNTPKPELPLRLSIAPPEQGSVTAFSLSPDGRSVAFPLIQSGKTQLWVRRLDSEAAQRLSGTEGADDDEAPAWSPDGRQLAFVSGGILKALPASGGPVRSLAPARNRGLTWNAKGIILFVNFSQTISRISTSGSRPRFSPNWKGLNHATGVPFLCPMRTVFFFGNSGFVVGSRPTWTPLSLSS